MNSWGKLKKILENEFLANSLKGHITYYRTMLRPKSRMDKDDNFYTGVMNIKYDGVVIFSADNKEYFIKGYDKLEGNIFQSPNNSRHNKITIYNKERVENLQIESAKDNAVYYKDFREYLDLFMKTPIQDALHSKNPIFRMLAILDRRVGKRTLEKIMNNYKDEPEWLQKIIEIRLKSEKLIS